MMMHADEVDNIEDDDPVNMMEVADNKDILLSVLVSTAITATGAGAGSGSTSSRLGADISLLIVLFSG